MSNGFITYDLRRISIEEARPLCEKFHGYGSVGGTATYAFGVFEKGALVAAYVWQPPHLEPLKTYAQRHHKESLPFHAWLR